MTSVDLNCDMGESFGPWTMGRDLDLMDYVSSVNIACGFHAGDASTIRKTVEAAISKNLSVGAHPSYPDLQGFGRRNMSLTQQEVFDIVLYQVSALKGITEALGGRLRHVKPHGALYNQAANDPTLAQSILEAISKIDAELVVYGLSGSVFISAAKEIGLRTASEVFADRTYQDQGRLTPRNMSGALITDKEVAAKQALQMVRDRTVRTSDGGTISVNAETLCIHGDSENAYDVVREVCRVFAENGITIAPPH